MANGDLFLNDDYLQVKISATKQQAESVEDALLGLGALSCTFEDATDTPIHEPAPGTTPLWNEVEITGLFTASSDGELLAGLLVREINGLSREDIALNALQGCDWERAWMDDFKPIQINDSVWVVPSFCVAPNENATNIMIDPGLAFGSGTHATTALCLKWLGRLQLTNKTVIDYGCGSGILSVAAAMLGARRVFAYDIDSQALLATRENAQRNNVTESIEICTHDRDLPGGVDVIVANILLKPLLDLPARFATLLADGGRVGMSGVLSEQVATLASAYAPIFVHCETELEEQWVLYSAKKEMALKP